MLPKSAQDWTLTKRRDKFIKTGLIVVRHARRVPFQLPKEAVSCWSCWFLTAIFRSIPQLQLPPISPNWGGAERLLSPRPCSNPPIAITEQNTIAASNEASPPDETVRLAAAGYD